MLKMVFVLLFIASTGCYPVREGLFVSDVLDNRERYLGQELVLGTLSITAKAIFLCDKKETEICINLSVPSRSLEIARISDSNEVAVRGVYVDHEFKNHGGIQCFFHHDLSFKTSTLCSDC